jgi:hypothetical protein
MARTNRVNAEGLERRARAVELRRKRWSFDQIGADLGVSAARAHQLWKDGITMVPIARIEEIRAEELEFADIAINALLKIAYDEDVSPRTRVEAWNAVRGWAERKAKIAGIDAAVKYEKMPGIEDERDAELRAMIDEAKAQIVREREAAGDADE